MADTASSSSSRVISGKGVNAKVVVPMKLFATWEVDRTSPNCIPRLCSLRLTRLCVLKPLENDLSSLIIAVRMQSSKRTLRSNEIVFPSSKNLETELDLSFSLQYPHFLKRDGNKLQVMLQRRKRYKNRTILGYKTLATGDINMSEVLQRSKDSELRLFNQTKEMEKEVAVVSVLGLSSQPVDQLSKRLDNIADAGYNESDDDDDSYSSDQDNSDSAENLENQDLDVEEDGKSSRTKQIANRQRNLKQKFINLLKRLKVASDESDTDQYPFTGQAAIADDDSLYGDLLGNMSDSEPEMELDDVSIESTPKPVLRPFFSQGIPTSGFEAEVMDKGNISKTSENGFNQESDDQSSDEGLHLIDQPPPKSVSTGTLALSSSNTPNSAQKDNNSRPRSSSGKEKQGHRQTLRSNSLNYSDHTQEEARKSLADRLSLLWPHNDSIPEKFILVNSTEWQGQVLSHKLQQEKHRVVCTFSSADVEDTMLFLVTKIQKYCNQNPKVPKTIKLVICGGDGYVGTVLRPYVEQFSAKSPDWQKYVCFYIIPLGNSSLAKYLGAVDSKYHSMFVEPSWRELFEKADKEQPETHGIVSRVSKYLSTATCNHQLRIGEVMVNYKLKNTGAESTQKFIPFINSVTIGANSSNVATSSFSEPEDSSSPLSTSPKEKDGPTPPSSPATISNNAALQQSTSPPAAAAVAELMDLQVEYWPMCSGMKKDKSSLKTTFRSLIVNRLSSSKGQSDSSLSMTIVTKERNKKTKQVMRIGKKYKDSEKSQVIDGIYRLVCTSKSQNNSLTVNIDGNELTGVKFFQLTAQTHSHIKQFPVIVFTES